MHLLADQKRLKDEYKDSEVLPKVNTANMAGTIKVIEEYLRSCCGIIILPLAYVMRKTIIVQTYGDYPKYMTPCDEMINGMLHLPP